MGLSSSKSTSKTTYGKDALPKINAATDAVNNAYKAAQPDISSVTSALRTTFGDYSTSNPTLDAANGYVSDVLGGKYLSASNPYLQGIVDTTNGSVADRVNALFSQSGQTGSSRQIGELGKQLSAAENNLRYQDYNTQLGRMDSAVGMATGLNSANNSNVATQLALGQGLTGIGTDAAQQYAQAIASLWGNNVNTTQKNSPSLASSIGSALSTAGQAASLFSERRVKRDIEKIGSEPDGLGIYNYNYVWDDAAEPVRTGVMVDEVERLRPWALGPVVSGIQTVNYGAL